MYKALMIIVVFVGASIGLLVPTGQGTNAVPAPVRPGERRVPVETRVTRSPSGHFYVHANVNGQLVHFIVDTGATTVALTEADAERVGIKFDPDNFGVIGSGASGAVNGAEIQIASVELDGKEVNNIRGVVIEGGEMSLIGQTYLSQLNNVQMSGDTMVLR
jgi:aspartyl protease family protein